MRALGPSPPTPLRRRSAARSTVMAQATVTAVAPLDRAEAHHLSFLANAKYAALAAERRRRRAARDARAGGRRAARTRASSSTIRTRRCCRCCRCSIRPPSHVAGHPSHGDHRSRRRARRRRLDRSVRRPRRRRHASARGRGSTRTSSSVTASRSATTVISIPRVTLYSGTELGRRVRVHAGARLGSDGFGYVFRDGAHVKIPHVGRCLVEDDVEIGANTTIDRGSIDDTVIGAGTKIDNLVQVAHNVRIGRLCLLMAQVGIAGSVRVEDGCILAGQVGHRGASSRSGAARDWRRRRACSASIPAGETWSGYPARPHREALRAQAAMFKLPSLIRALERLVDASGTTSADAANDRPGCDRDGNRSAPRRRLHAGVPPRARAGAASSSSGATCRRRRRSRRSPSHAVLTERRTQLGEEPNAVHTVEHVLAAVARARARRPGDLDRRAGAADHGRQRAALPRGAARGGHRGAAGLRAVSRGSRAPVRLEDGESVYEASPADAPRARRDDRLPAPADRAAAVRRARSRPSRSSASWRGRGPSASSARSSRSARRG